MSQVIVVEGKSGALLHKMTLSGVVQTASA